jgi:hypothetical protein
MESISCAVLPIRHHAFFEETVFQGELGHDLLQSGCLAAKLLELSVVAARAVSTANRFLLAGCLAHFLPYSKPFRSFTVLFPPGFGNFRRANIAEVRGSKRSGR